MSSMATSLFSSNGIVWVQDILDLSDGAASQHTDKQLSFQSLGHAGDVQNFLQHPGLAAKDGGVCLIHSTNVVVLEEFDWD